MTVEEKLERLTGIVDSLAGAVVAHDNQIEEHNNQIGALIQIVEKHENEMATWKDEVRSLARQLQAYLKRLPPQ